MDVLRFLTRSAFLVRRLVSFVCDKRVLLMTIENNLFEQLNSKSSSKVCVAFLVDHIIKKYKFYPIG